MTESSESAREVLPDSLNSWYQLRLCSMLVVSR